MDERKFQQSLINRKAISGSAETEVNLEKVKHDLLQRVTKLHDKHFLRKAQKITGQILDLWLERVLRILVIGWH